MDSLLPVVCAVAAALVLFFVLKDLGPGAGHVLRVPRDVTAPRGDGPALAVAALAVMVASVAVGYRMGQPHTVVDRIHMWLSPWDNDVRGGDQLAHALWAFSTGGPLGSGPGWGDPAMIPAGNTDLVLPAIGEEWGFAGVAAVFLLFGISGMARRCAPPPRANTHFGFFLALGLGSLIAFEMLLISAGVLGVLPLSGVVSPFLSSGNTAMLANFLSSRCCASISADGEAVTGRTSAAALRPLKMMLALAACALLAVAAQLPVGARQRVSRARRARIRRRRREARAAQSAHQFARPRDPARQHLRPQRHSARHQQLGRAGAASRGIRRARHLASTRPARASTAAIIPSARHRRTWWATSARARISTPRMPPWWNTIPT